MSERQQAQDPATNPMAERLRRAKELSDATLMGARSTAEGAAIMAASEAESQAEAVGDASRALAESLGRAVTGAVEGTARSGGALAGGMMGTAGGLWLAAQLGGSATLEATRSVLGSSARAAGRITEGFLVALEDEAQGADQVRQAARDLVQEVFDATTGAALGTLGGLATAAGAVAGGAKGAAGGALDGARRIGDVGADAAWVAGRETAKGSTEVLRRALRREEEL